MKVEGSLEFTVVEQTADRVVSEMPIHSGVKNPFGVVHAGAMLWLADVTATMLVLGPVQTAEGMKAFRSRSPERELRLQSVRRRAAGGGVVRQARTDGQHRAHASSRSRRQARRRRYDEPRPLAVSLPLQRSAGQVPHAPGGRKPDEPRPHAPSSSRPLIHGTSRRGRWR